MDLVERIRRFQGDWTEVLDRIGALDPVSSPAEERVLERLARDPVRERQGLTAELGIDASFMTRILRRLQEQGRVEVRTSAADRRRQDLSLTPAGLAAAADHADRARAAIGALVDGWSAEDRARLAEAMDVVARLARPPAPSTRGPVLRAPGPGDLGWIVLRHGELAAELGWTTAFEGWVARVVGQFQGDARPDRDRAWIAELDGVRAGCVLYQEKDDGLGRIRLLLVEPSARRRGIGRALVDACLGFAARAGHRRVTLWSHEGQAAAERLFARAGFRVAAEDRAQAHGRDVTGHTWEWAVGAEHRSPTAGFG